jgi:hypothetical protein
MPSNSVVLNVQGSCSSGSSSSGSSSSGGFSLMLDSILNNNKSIFDVGQTAYMKLYKGGLNPTLRATLGTIALKRQNVYEIITEQIVFIRSNTGSLAYEPVNAGRLAPLPSDINGIEHIPIAPATSPIDNTLSEMVNWQWQGNAPNVNILFADKTITLNPRAANANPIFTGILNVAYYTTYDSIALQSQMKGAAICEAYVETITPNLTPSKNNQAGTITTNIYGSLLVKFGGNTYSAKRPVTITVKDACSQALVARASVEVDGYLVGTTAANGTVDCGSLAIGEHTLKITALGYTDSDKDTILNDSFTVPGM